MSSSKTNFNSVTPNHQVAKHIGHKRTSLDDIPTFDGDEFSGKKPKSEDTMTKLKRFVRSEPPKKIQATLDRIVSDGAEKAVRDERLETNTNS